MRWLSNKLINRASYMDEEHILDNYSNYIDATAYYSLHKDLKQKKALETNTNIVLNHGEQDSLSFKPKSVRRLFGKPNAKLMSRRCTENVLIYFYRKIIGGHKVKLELHFIDNKLFFYNYRFSHLNAADKASIIEILEGKYLQVTTIDIANNYISDINGSRIIINDGVEFSMEYIVCTSSFNKIVTHALKQKEIIVNELQKEIKVFTEHI